MKDLKIRALRGGSAKLCAQGFGFSVRLVSLAVLARLLDPKDFGLVAMVTVVTGVFALFKDAGLSVATVQRTEITEEQLSALFWVNCLVGVTLAGLTLAAAPILATFYDEPRLFPVAAVLGVGFLVNAAGVQHAAVLQRRMRFVTLAAIDSVSWLISASLGIALAYSGWRHWSLVGMSLALPIASTTGMWLGASWIPSLPRPQAGVKSMVWFGGTVTLNSLVVYVAYNLDKLLIGKLWGAEALGFYGRAYQLVSIPTDNLNSAIGDVAISAFSRVKHDAARFRRYFLASYSLVLTFTVPLTASFALFADDIVFVVLGPKWAASAAIFRLLAPTIMALALLNPLSWLLLASGHVARSLRMAVVIALVVIAGYLVGVRYGAEGVAVSYSTSMACLSVPMIAWAVRGTVVSFSDVVAVIRAPILATILATALSALCVFVLGTEHSSISRLLLGGGTFGVGYIAALLLQTGQKAFHLELIRDLRRSTEARHRGQLLVPDPPAQRSVDVIR
jgi:PST family polysaccharide transporter